MRNSVDSVLKTLLSECKGLPNLYELRETLFTPDYNNSVLSFEIDLESLVGESRTRHSNDLGERLC